MDVSSDLLQHPFSAFMAATIVRRARVGVSFDSHGPQNDPLTGYQGVTLAVCYHRHVGTRSQLDNSCADVSAETSNALSGTVMYLSIVLQ